MKKTEIVIQNQTGLHARPAKVLVNLAKQFRADIVLYHGEKKANAKSMVSVLTLGAGCGSQVTVQASGEDEEKALAELAAAFRAGLGDEIPPVKPAVAEPQVLPAAAAPQPVMIVSSKNAAAAGIIQAIAASPGIAIGPIFHFRQADPDLSAAI